MNKLRVILIVLVCCAKQGYSQTFNEWFHQKKTQTKYLIEQIAALQVYLDELEKGYSALHKGLSLIGDIKNGELSLHQNYFTGLKTVNPHIMKYPKIAGILSLQLGILRQYHEALSHARESGEFDASEMATIKKISNNLMEQSEKDLDELTTVTASGALEMTDDARIAAIDRLYTAMQEKYDFMENFSARITQLVAQREQGNNDAETLHKLYDEP